VAKKLRNFEFAENAGGHSNIERRRTADCRLVCSVWAFAIVVAGLLTWARWPLIGTLQMIGAMAPRLSSPETVSVLRAKRTPPKKQTVTFGTNREA
jgi:hypothetical protein